MRNLIFLIFTVFLPFISLSQIPNGGFEEWEVVDNKEKPVFWETNQDTIHRRISKDSISIEGDYSIRFESDATTGWSECTSKIAIATGFNEPLKDEIILSFYLKLEPLNPNDATYFNIFLRPSFEGTFLNSFVWQTDLTYDEFTLIEIPLGYSAIDSVYIEIGAGALNGADDGCYNQNICWLDRLDLKERTTNVEENETPNQISVYPNPSTGKINLKGSISNFEEYAIYDLQGTLITKSKIKDTTIDIESKGIFLLELRSSNPQIEKYSQLVVIQ